MARLKGYIYLGILGVVGWSRPVEGYTGEPEVVDRSKAYTRVSDVNKDLM